MAHARARRAGAYAGSRRLRQQVGKMAPAHHADQQSPGKRHIRHMEQRHRQSYKNLRAFYPYARKGQSRTARADNRSCASRHVRSEQGSVLAGPAGRAPCKGRPLLQ